jgi:AraC-like DNA-binding protein
VDHGTTYFVRCVIAGNAVDKASGEAVMKPVYQKLIGSLDEGFVVKEIHGEVCNCPWHCHSEVELVFVLKSQGYRLVGDTIHSLQSGDLVLLGANLPHAYQHTDRRSTASAARCVLLQFDESSWSGLFELPVAAPVRRLLQRAGKGLQIMDPTRKQVAAMLQQMLKLRGLRRVGVFLAMLDILAQSRSCRSIAGPGFAMPVTSSEQDRIGRICQFIDENYHRALRIGEVAKLAHMSEGSFSRFFHAHIGKTFPGFLNDLRVGRACRRLTESDMNVTEIASSCGYQNLSNFNRQFFRLKQVSPSEFRRQVRHSGQH